MSFGSALGAGLVSALVLAGVAQAEEDVEKIFGVFRAACATNPDTHVRKCNLRLRPEGRFFAEHRMMPFLVFIYPDETSVDTMGSIPSLRVDKNPPIVGDCSEQLSSSGLCSSRTRRKTSAS